MGRLTTHILDTANGRPAAGVKIDLYAVDRDGSLAALTSAITNSDGRCDKAILEGSNFETGTYELRFYVGAYFDGLSGSEGPAFLDVVPVRFGISDANEHYHVPLLISPFGYSTYRGS